jgi:hypothetical protein
MVMVTDARKRKNGDDDSDLDRDDEVLEDGHALSVKMLTMDALQKSVFLCDQERKRALRAGIPFDFRNPTPSRDANPRAARREMIDRTVTAWRSPNAIPNENSTPRPAPLRDAPNGQHRPLLDAQQAAQMRRAARETRDAALQTAWRNIPNPSLSTVETRDMEFHRATPQEFLTALNRRRDGAQPDYGTRPGDNPEEMRRRALAERDAYLVNAWKSPASAANAIEQARRRATHE